MSKATLAAGPGAAGAEHHDVIVVGAGFGGIYAVHRFRNQGLDVICLEAASDVGGVWRHNRYPGARCDLLSADYSYSFSEELQQEWEWSYRYSPQPEILAYLQHVADRFDLRRSMRFNTRVMRAVRDGEAGLWVLDTEDGQRLTADFVVLATGPLSIPKEPDFPGLSDFKGEIYQTSRWPDHPVTFEGKRVAVIGTGSSGVQAITEIGKTAGHLSVFQRTPAFSAPSQNRPTDREESARFRASYSEYREKMRNDFAGAYMFSSGKTAAECTPEEREAILDAFWEEGGMGYVTAFNDVLFDEDANAVVADYMRKRMAEVVTDPVLLEKLTPRGYAVGTRRPCCDAGYFETFNRENVLLVDLRETPIVRFTEAGIETTDGQHDLDIIVLALGFDAITGAFSTLNPVNENGLCLNDHWRDGPHTFLGLTVAEFPNMFLVNGPGAAVAANVPLLVELSVDWIGDCIAWLKANGLTTIKPTPEVERAWHAEVLDIGDRSLFMRTPSWFTGGNIAGKPRGMLVYLGGFNNFAARCREVAQKNYEGFVVS